MNNKFFVRLCIFYIFLAFISNLKSADPKTTDTTITTSSTPSGAKTTVATTTPISSTSSSAVMPASDNKGPASISADTSTASPSALSGSNLKSPIATPADSLVIPAAPTATPEAGAKAASSSSEKSMGPGDSKKDKSNSAEQATIGDAAASAGDAKAAKPTGDTPKTDKPGEEVAAFAPGKSGDVTATRANIKDAKNNEAQQDKSKGPEEKPSLDKKPDKSTSAKPSTEPFNFKESTVSDIAQFDRERINFSFENKPLLEIVNMLASKRKVNIILPQGNLAETISKQNVTYKPTDKSLITVGQAWDLLSEFLRLAGFSLFAKKTNLYQIIATGKKGEAGINQEPLPLFIETRPVDLPKNVNRIRYINYLKNLRVPSGPEDRENPLTQLFTEMLSNTTIPIFEPKSNGFVIVDSANKISSLMQILLELDATGFKEAIEVIPLYNVPAIEVSKIFEQARLAAAGQDKTSPFLRADPKADTISYFASDTKVIPDEINNSMILMGRETAVSRISEFIQEYIDQPAEQGKSILHTYDLQYLEAKSFAGVLQEIVKGSGAGVEATQGSQATAGGVDRFFQGVVVAAEQVKNVEETATTEKVELIQTGTDGTTDAKGIEGKIITGGNRLIITALQDDWIRIKELIDKLDKPQPQVILEVLIVDFTNVDNRTIAGDFRTRTDTSLFDQAVELLASHISGVEAVLGNTPAEAAANATVNAASNTQLARDLLGVIASDTQLAVTSPSVLDPGSILISFNDPSTPGIFALLQVLQLLTNSKIISHPYLVTTNNQKATITSQVIKRARGDAINSPSGNITVQIDNIPATLQVQMVPRISLYDQFSERLSLQIAVDINEFIGTTLNRLVRRVETNANIQSGQVLVIGGLTRVDTADATSETPILARIPILGAFFRKTSKEVAKSNLAVFISPTIVHPKLRGGMNTYTTDKVRKGRRDVGDVGVLNETRDPIIRLFFGRQPENDRLMKQYLAQTDNAPTLEHIKTTREKRREARRPRRPQPFSRPNRPGSPSKISDRASNNIPQTKTSNTNKVSELVA